MSGMVNVRTIVTELTLCAPPPLPGRWMEHSLVHRWCSRGSHSLLLLWAHWPALCWLPGLLPFLPAALQCICVFLGFFFEYQWTQFVFDPWPHKKELPLFMDSCIIMTEDWNCTVTNYSVDHFNLKYFVLVCRHICKSYFSSLPLNIAQNQYGYLINTK